MKGVLIKPCPHDTRSHSSAGSPVPDVDFPSDGLRHDPRIELRFREQMERHDAEVARAERERVLDIIRRTDAGACPYEQCHSGEGHDGLNCRDCLIKFVEDTLRSGEGVQRNG